MNAEKEMIGQNNVAPPGLKFIRPFMYVTIISARWAFFIPYINLHTCIPTPEG